jgi:hypothetical protein
MYNGRVERVLKFNSTQQDHAMKVLKLSWRREVLKAFNMVEH